MNVNVKLSLDDDERRALASYLVGKPVKRLATRAEVNEIVKDLLAGVTILGNRPATPRYPEESDPEAVSVDETGTPAEFCSDDCCRRNDLLQTRVNRLQHRLDTMG